MTNLFIKRISSYLLGIFILVIFIIATLLFLGSISNYGVAERGTKYVIPENYSGWICVNYNSDAAPLLEDSDGFMVVNTIGQNMVRTSSPMLIGKSYDKFYNIIDNVLVIDEDLRIGGGITVNDEKSLTHMFWVSTGKIKKDYLKYINNNLKDKDKLCTGRWN